VANWWDGDPLTLMIKSSALIEQLNFVRNCKIAKNESSMTPIDDDVWYCACTCIDVYYLVLVLLWQPIQSIHSTLT
jgi:hypothetical protein